MPFGSVVSRRKTCHIARISSTAVDEKNGCSQGQQQEQAKEKEAPGLNVGQGRSPQDPEKRQIEEDAVATGNR